MILAIAPSPSLDVTYVVEELVEGGHVRPLEVHRVAGGKAINAARAARALGAEVRVVAPLGGTSGAFIAEELAHAGIALHAVPTGPTRTCVSVFARVDGTMTEIYEQAPPIADAWAGMLTAIGAELATAGPVHVLLSGSVPPTGAPDPLGDVARLVAQAGARWAVDTHGEALRRAMELAPEIVKVNKAEAAEALGADGDARALALALHERTRGVAIVTDGPAGVVAVDGEHAIRALLPGVRGGFPVGSGDTMLGTLVASLDAGEPLEGALAVATAAATANALVPGAAVYREDDLRRLRALVELSPA
ncbi:1-phosphofructokinase family hexose kinase [Pseudolysinimonas kribbensis]|uniref:1-phosphofructokinase family hexose kinase n=1 Tax=Pseudolysinimonas kribbensis TaxID=433641 RepID=UPI0031D0E2A1